jgi:hypothetical protein
MLFPVMKILEGYLITTPEKNIWRGVRYLLWNLFDEYIYLQQMDRGTKGYHNTSGL